MNNCYCNTEDVFDFVPASVVAILIRLNICFNVSTARYMLCGETRSWEPILDCEFWTLRDFLGCQRKEERERKNYFKFGIISHYCSVGRALKLPTDTQMRIFRAVEKQERHCKILSRLFSGSKPGKRARSHFRQWAHSQAPLSLPFVCVSECNFFRGLKTIFS